MVKNALPKLATKATLSALDKFERKIREQGVIATSGAGAMRAGKGFTFFISNKDMDGIIKIVESLKNQVY